MQFTSKTGVCGMDRHCQEIAKVLNTLNILSERTTLREKVAKRVRSFAPTSNTTRYCYPFNAEIKAVRYSILTMEGPNLRDEAVRDRIRLAEEFLDRGK